MSKPETVDISEWINRARNDRQRYLERQATEIILTAFASSPYLSENVFLKGGTLMGVIYQSPRQTTDLDFTAALPPSAELPGKLRETLNVSFPKVSASLGYPDIICRVQTLDIKPREKAFSTANFPALILKVAFAERGTNQHRQLENGQCVNTISLDISFNEPVTESYLIKLGPEGAHLRVYTLTDLIAEKFRAYLQQEKRNRIRRQDIYDLALLLPRFNFDAREQANIHQAIQRSCRSHDIEPTAESIDSDELQRRAKLEWETIKLEVDEVPPFELCFKIVREFYKGLPWEPLKESG